MESFRLILIAILSACYLAPSLSAQETDARIDKAREQFTSAIKEARADLIEELDDKVESAKRRGSLESVEALNQEKTAFMQKGSLPSLVRTTAYSADIKRATDDLSDVFDEVIEEAVKNDMVEQAKKYRDELTQIKNSVANVITPDALVTYEIVEGIKEIAPLRLKSEIYSNRKYLWEIIPPGLPFDRFARMPGGGKTPLKLKVNKPGWVYIALSSAKPELSTPYLKQESWEPTKIRYNATNATNGYFVFRKWCDVGDYQIARLNFSGPIPLLPKAEEQ